MTLETAFRRMKRRVRTRSAECDRATVLNKYYTRPEVARECSNLFEHYISRETLLIEPSAGGGAFLDAAHRPIFGYDVAPEHPDVIARDFLADGLSSAFLRVGDIALLGNPPFGRRSSLALQFLNRGLQYTDTVGFILPTSFQRWDTQRKVTRRARLVLDHELPEDAFTFLGRPYALRCTFQVWTLKGEHPDLRLTEPPQRDHPDFQIMQYCPDSARSMRHFATEWDFAVRFQGDHDYGVKAYRPDHCNRRHHWMMFNARDGAALERLLNIDFVSLSRKRSIVPGFARSDVVASYEGVSGP